MRIKVAAICMSNEKEWVDGKLRYFYAYPTSTPQETDAAARYFLDKSVRLARKAASNGAKMACLPEGAIEIGKWLRHAPPKACYDMARKWWDAALEAWSKTARECGMVLVGGAVEPDGRRYYNSAPVFDDCGNLLGCYHKVQLTPDEAKFLTHGDGFPVFKTRYGKLGVFICWDIIFPEAVQSLAYNGAQILFHPTYGHSGPMAEPMAQTRAVDAVCPLVIAMWCGQGAIIDRDGTVLARAHRTRDWSDLIPDQILYAEVDPLAKREWVGQKDFRKSVFAQRRWGVYSPPRRA